MMTTTMPTSSIPERVIMIIMAIMIIPLLTQYLKVKYVLAMLKVELILARVILEDQWSAFKMVHGNWSE